MEGTGRGPFHPSCSHFIAFFSFSQTVNIFRALSVPFETVDVLADDRLRSSLKEYSVSAFIIFERLGLLWAGNFEK